MAGNEAIEYKLVLIGNCDVGKTSIFKKITTDVFTEKNISTIGMDKRSLTFEIEVNENNKKQLKNFDISLVDTAGQERFKSITKTYFKGADGIILLYDVTNKESFDQIENWLESIHESIGNQKNSKYIIFLLGNKIDLIGEDGIERCVSEHEAEEKCKEHNLLWGKECSAKTFSQEDFNNMFKVFVEKIYQKIGAKDIKQQKIVKIKRTKKKKKFKFCG